MLTREGVESSFGESQGVVLHPLPSFISKTQMRTGDVGALKPVWIPCLPLEEATPNVLCPVECLMKYLERSDKYRSVDQKRLFIPWQGGQMQDVKAQTISVYIKKAVLLAYSDADETLLQQLRVVPHTIRHIATPLRAMKSFSMKEILQTGSWSSPNSFINHYLQDFTTNTVSGLSSLGGFVVGGAQF